MARKYLPLAPVGTPGIWTYVANMVPTRCGSYYPGNQFAAIATPALATPGTTNRAWCALYGNDSVVGYVGTSTKLWQYDGATTFTDRSSGAYTGGARAWQFAQFGDITIASNRADAVQYRDVTAGGAFANLANAPKGNIIVTQSEQVLIFDFNDGAEKRDAFSACGPGDYTDWTSANATLATRIRHRPGKITAAVAFKDYVLAFKQSSVYKLTYTGNNVYKWRVECIAVGKGAWAPFDVVHCGEFVIFSGHGGVWKFDGSTFTCITDGVGQFLFTPAASWFSPRSGNVYFDTSSDAMVYNIYSDTWGKWGRYTNISNGTGAQILLSGDPAAMHAFAPTTTAKPDYTLGFGSDLSTGKAWGASSYFVGTSITGLYCGLATGVEGIGGRRLTRFGGANVESTISITRTSDIGPSVTALTLFGDKADSKDAYSLSDTAFFGAIVSGSLTSLATSATAQHRFDFQMGGPYGRFALSMGVGYIEVLDLPLSMIDAGSR